MRIDPEKDYEQVYEVYRIVQDACSNQDINAHDALESLELAKQR